MNDESRAFALGVLCGNSNYDPSYNTISTMVQSGETPMTHKVYRGRIVLQSIVKSDHLPCRDGVSAEKLCRFSAGLWARALWGWQHEPSLRRTNYEKVL